MKKAPSKSAVLLLSFFLPMGLMAAVFAVCGLVPFGQRTLGVMDMSHQYIGFLASLRDIIAGRAGLLYLPSMCLGGNMLGVAAYYLTSPLNLITCLFPRENLYTAVSLLYFLRVGLSGLTMCVYAGRRHGYGLRCLIPAMAYAFMAYTLAYSINYIWQDCVILLPLIALGIARLAEERRPFLYILSLAGALYLNFYIGYILCIFSVLFFLAELFSRPRTERRGAGRTVATFALSSLAAGGLAAVMLLPAFRSLSGGKAAFDLSVLTLTPKFDPVSLLSKFYPGAFVYEEIMPEGLPQVFCGSVTAVLTVLYFVNPRIPRRRRLLTGGLMLALTVSFWITALDLIWHGLNDPNWYNYRYSFLLCFLMAAAADRELCELREGTEPRQLLLPVGVIAAVSVLVFAGRTYAYVSWPSAAAAVLIAAAVSGALFVCLRPGTGTRLTAGLFAAIFLVHAGELAVNAKITMQSLTAQATDSAAFADYVEGKAEAFALIGTGEEYVRVESPVCFDQDRCEPMLFGYDGLSHYGSTIPQDNLNFLDRVGFDRYGKVWATYGPGVPASADTLLGVRYIVGDMPGKNYTLLGEAGGYTVWENEIALPVGWTADAAIADGLGTMDSFSYIDALYAAAAPEVGESIFRRASAGEPALANFTADGTRFTKEADGAATLTWSVTVAADGPLYGEFDIPDFPGVMIYADGTLRTMYASAQTNGAVYLGDHAAGETVEVRLQAFFDITVNHAAFATESSEALSRYAAALAEGGCPLTKLSTSHYTGHFTTGDGDAYLVFTIPYDRCWTVQLDGETVQPAAVQDGLMALRVTPGGHTVELRYVPAGLIPGAVISAVSAAAVLAAYRLLRKKRS